MKAMKLTEVDSTDAEKYITDPDWVIEQKFDGARAILVLQDGRIEWLSGSGKPLKFAAARQHCEAIEQEVLARFGKLSQRNPQARLALDGELMIDSGLFRVFDLPVLEDEPYEFRRKHLRRYFEDFPAEGESHLVPVRQESTESGKRALWQSICEQGVEGAVAKRQDGLYEQGKRVKHQVKLKLVKTADVIVTGITNWTKTTGSAELSVTIDPADDPEPWVDANGKRTAKEPNGRKFWINEPRSIIPIANASLIGKDKTIEYGCVVEVRYLYWTGSSIVQPRIVGRRTDKTPDECRLDQFPEYSRQEV